MSRWLHRGSNALEFALMVAVVVPMVLSAAEYGWYLGLRVAAETCTRDAVRVAAGTCNPANCNAVFGGECGSCLDPQGTDVSAMASARLVQCWAETGYPGTATATVTRAGTATQQNRRITVDAEVTYQAIAVTSLLPNPIHTSLTMRMDDQSL